jgi:hypothetical protein
MGRFSPADRQSEHPVLPLPYIIHSASDPSLGIGETHADSALSLSFDSLHRSDGAAFPGRPEPVIISEDDTGGSIRSHVQLS